MDLKITGRKRNEILKRDEVIAEVKEKTIPSKKQIREKLSALLDAPQETIAIIKVESKFGSPAAKIFARAYDSLEELKKREVKYIRERNFGKEKKAESVEQAMQAPPANFKK